MEKKEGLSTLSSLIADPVERQLEATFLCIERHLFWFEIGVMKVTSKEIYILYGCFQHLASLPSILNGTKFSAKDELNNPVRLPARVGSNRKAVKRVGKCGCSSVFWVKSR